MISNNVILKARDPAYISTLKTLLTTRSSVSRLPSKGASVLRFITPKPKPRFSCWWNGGNLRRIWMLTATLSTSLTCIGSGGYWSNASPTLSAFGINANSQQN